MPTAKTKAKQKAATKELKELIKRVRKLEKGIAELFADFEDIVEEVVATEK